MCFYVFFFFFPPVLDFYFLSGSLTNLNSDNFKSDLTGIKRVNRRQTAFTVMS